MQHHVVSSKAQMPEPLLPQKYWQNTGAKFGHEWNQSPDPNEKPVAGLFKEINALHSFAAHLYRIYCIHILLSHTKRSIKKFS